MKRPKFSFAHTMLRVKDLEKSLDFYCRILGMQLVCRDDYPEAKFSLCFLSFADEREIPENQEEKRHWLATTRGILELTHNWGTENNPDFFYDTGNGKTGGYGHIAISVDDFAAAISYLDKENVPFKKRPEEGRMSDIAFILDPDGYFVEIIKQHK
ncbi:MAG: lactoylglutathione lyase [Cardiobacteriaceae bacterium]|nr:lactoylglutathione lyase [Cardiobacteriaceae bacterium]